MKRRQTTRTFVKEFENNLGHFMSKHYIKVRDNIDNSKVAGKYADGIIVVLRAHIAAIEDSEYKQQAQHLNSGNI